MDSKDVKKITDSIDNLRRAVEKQTKSPRVVNNFSSGEEPTLFKTMPIAMDWFGPGQHVHAIARFGIQDGVIRVNIEISELDTIRVHEALTLFASTDYLSLDVKTAP
jgi:hypothetical protein